MAFSIVILLVVMCGPGWPPGPAVTKCDADDGEQRQGTAPAMTCQHKLTPSNGALLQAGIAMARTSQVLQQASRSTRRL